VCRVGLTSAVKETAGHSCLTPRSARLIVSLLGRVDWFFHDEKTCILTASWAPVLIGPGLQHLGSCSDLQVDEGELIQFWLPPSSLLGICIFIHCMWRSYLEILISFDLF
jgi:hypothetical protein